MNRKKKYQHGFSEKYYDEMYDFEARKLKAKKIKSVIEDYFSGNVSELSLLDVGCSNGYMTKIFSENVGRAVGTDIDDKALNYAKENFASDKLSFKKDDSMNMGFEDNSFDIVTCNQVYEHVPDSKILMKEIYRVLKPGGICYFACSNRLRVIEDHYQLPFLSIIPKFLAHLYLRILGKGKYYYENHLTVWGLRKLVKKFDIKDYTKKIIRDPEKYFAIDMVKPNTGKQKIALYLLRFVYWFFPAYVWVLKK